MRICVSLCVVSVCLSATVYPHYCTDPDVTWAVVGDGPCELLSGFAISARLRCYGNITRTRNVSEYMLELALCLHFCNWSYCFRTLQFISFQYERSSRGPSVSVEMLQDVPGVRKMSSLRIRTRSERRPISTTASCTAVHYGC